MGLKRRLGRVRPADTNANTIYTVAADTYRATATSIWVCNVSGVATTYSLFDVGSGDSADEDTALAWAIPLDANAVDVYEIPVELGDVGQLLVVIAGDADAITVTAYGELHEYAY